MMVPHSRRRKGAGMSDRMPGEAPKRIWIQWFGDQSPEDCDGEPSEVTWSETPVWDHDVEYRRVTPTDEACREIVRRLAEWDKKYPDVMVYSFNAEKEHNELATDAAKLWAEMQRDAKGGDGGSRI